MTEPIGFLSPGQLPAIVDPPDSVSGTYLPVRKTPGGNFTMAIYAEPPQSKKRLSVAQINSLPEAAGWWPMGIADRIMKLVRAVERAHGITEYPE